jgi:REP element-mobilizing transposase RayT
MPRQPRMIVEGESAVYHVMSRTALEGFVLGSVEKDYLLQLIKHFSSVYFAEILGFAIMGNHFHIVVRMHIGEEYSDDEICKRFGLYYQNDKKKRAPMPNQLPALREKWGKLSEFMKEIKQAFSRFYNKRHKRRGFFWSDRFKSVLVENGEALVNCLAYVDLNPVRAGIVVRPDEYRWNSLGYHLQTGNKESFLSLDFGLTGCAKSQKQRLIDYRKFVYEVGSLKTDKGASIDRKVVENEAEKGFAPNTVDRFLARTRYFTDSGIIGSREFVRNVWERFRTGDDTPDKIPTRVSGLDGLYSLKRLSENIL